ncbi:MAG: hypothetical protein RR086_06030 [Clostridia bacterium]
MKNFWIGMALGLVAGYVAIEFSPKVRKVLNEGKEKVMEIKQAVANN